MDLTFTNTPFGFTLELLNLKNGSIINTPAIPGNKTGVLGHQFADSIFFSKFSANLIFPAVFDYTYLAAPNAMSLSDSSLTDLCPGVQSINMNIQEISAGKFLIVTLDQSSGIISAYLSTLQNKSASCKKLNSTLTTDPQMNFIDAVSLSQDQQKIAVRVGHQTTTWQIDPNDGIEHAVTEANELFYIPLDGAPAILVSAPVVAGSKIIYSGFSNNSNQIIFAGDQLISGQNNVFLWSPNY